MRPISDSVIVGDTTPTRIFTFRPVDFHSVTIRVDRTFTDIVYIGAGGVSSGDGFDLAGGEALNFTYRDFNALKLRNPVQVTTLYAISGSGNAAVRLFGFVGGYL